MSIFYYVQHSIRYDDRRDRKGIGTFSSMANAQLAVAHSKDKPGFSDPRGSFDIYACRLDQSYWPRGLDDPGNSANVFDEVRTEQSQEKSIDLIYLLYYENTSMEADDQFILLGYYSSQELAAVAQKKITNSFNSPELLWQFGVSVSVVDRENWIEGFVSGN